MPFRDKLAGAETRSGSLLCVGLDPYLVEPGLVADFNRSIVEETCDLVSSYKPNLAIYEGMGPAGMKALEATIQCVPADIPVIGDGKRGDIENCGRSYAEALFGKYGLNLDAVTINPYMGQEVVAPFQQYWPDKMLLILCRTSNPRSTETQLLETRGLDGVVRPLYLEFARQAMGWGTPQNMGLVVGATFPDELRRVRQEFPDVLLLIPGLGAQGGSVESAVEAAADVHGAGFILSASRAVTFAAGDPSSVTRQNLGTFARAARRSALEYRDRINNARAFATVS
ncbi:MAG: orotidine-5'-phosphate decarboxylase [Dehalococcoidia bacterium]|nr:orotidine-5'-phosphate decarboxylase [Dehalococcoidia bacterium]